MELQRWHELVPSIRDAEEAIENVGRLQRLTALTKGIGGRAARAYFDIVARVCTSSFFGSQTHVSRPAWIASCTLTSVGLLVACVLSFVMAPLVHGFIDGIALLAYGTAATFAQLANVIMFVLAAVVDFLALSIYCVLVTLAIAVHVVMTVGSLIVAAGSVVFGVLGVYLALKYDPNILRSDTHQLNEYMR